MFLLCYGKCMLCACTNEERIQALITESHLFSLAHISCVCFLFCFVTICRIQRISSFPNLGCSLIVQTRTNRLENSFGHYNGHIFRFTFRRTDNAHNFIQHSTIQILWCTIENEQKKKINQNQHIKWICFLTTVISHWVH